MVFCVVLSCKSNQEPGRTYHRFPNDSSRLKQWLKILGFKEDELKWASAVCRKHFRTKDYYPGTKRLLPDAVPSIRLKPRGKDVNQVIHNSHSKLSTSKMNKPKSLKKSENNLNISNKSKNMTLNVQSSSKTQLPPIKSSDKKELISSQRNPIKGDPVVLSKNSALKKPTKSLQVKTSKLEKLTSSQNKKLPSIKSKKYFKGNLNASLKSKQDEFISKDQMSNEKTDKTILKKNTINTPQTHFTSAVEIHSTVNNKKLSNTEDKMLFGNENFELNMTPASFSKSVKRYLEESISDNQDIRKRLQRRRLILDSEQKSDSPSDDENQRTLGNSIIPCSLDGQKSMKEEKSNSRSNNKNNSILDKGVRQCSLGKQKNTRQDSRYSNVDNITNIEQTIFEMQNKILKLEKKSILDEKKIETFKKALIQQRNSDIKILMDEKENELLLRMDLLYLDYDPQRICRLCLLLVDRKESLISLLRPPNNQALLELIKNTTNVQIEFEDGMPSGICKQCLQQIKRVDWIRRRSQRSNMLIKKFLIMKKTLNKSSNIASGSGSTVLNSITEKTSCEKPQFGDDLFEEELSGALKIEDVFSLENSPESAPFDNVQLKQEVESDDEISKISLTNELPIKTHHKTFVRKVKECKDCGTIFTNVWTQKNHIKYCRRMFQCSECSKCFWNGQLFFKHKQRTQTCVCVESQRCCYDCEIVFRWKWQLLFHVILHSPQLCTLCDEKLHSVDHLKNHFMKSHLV